MPTTVTATNLPNLLHRGKVRDLYDLGDALLFVATDRISAFDVVLPDAIPEKGVVLNELSRFWFQRTAHIVPNHLIAMGHDQAAARRYGLRLEPEVARRAMIVRKAEPVRVECVVRGYLAGSAWAEYHRTGAINGHPAPPGLRESQRLERPLFTPTTKAATGHDQPLTRGELDRTVGAALAQDLERLTLALYAFAHQHATERGIIIADTKFEFGMVNGVLTLMDEALTPDSSRFWAAGDYRVGGAQDSFDKQIVRDWLTHSGWNKEPPAPRLPADVIARTAERYKEAYRRLTGEPLK